MWLRNETSKHDGLVPGQAIITRAKNLPVKHIIHTVGPVWKSDTEILRNCYKNSLYLAMEHNYESIAFPLISSGAFECPKDVALNVAVSSIGEFLLFNDMTVYLVVFDKQSYKISEKLYLIMAKKIIGRFIA